VLIVKSWVTLLLVSAGKKYRRRARRCVPFHTHSSRPRRSAELEGSVELLEGNLTVGPDGHISANVQARNIVIQGRVDGNLYGLERVDLKKSAVLVGDICTPRVAIEEGASLKGSVLVQKDIPTVQTCLRRGEKNHDTPLQTG
jgi:hypothetical protein